MSDRVIQYAEAPPPPVVHSRQGIIGFACASATGNDFGSATAKPPFAGTFPVFFDWSGCVWTEEILAELLDFSGKFGVGEVEISTVETSFFARLPIVCKAGSFRGARARRARGSVSFLCLCDSRV